MNLILYATLILVFSTSLKGDELLNTMNESSKAEALVRDLKNFRLFSVEKYSYKDLAEVVNFCIESGEKTAILALINIGWDDNADLFSSKERAFWVASILYSPIDSRANSSGYIRGLSLPEFDLKHKKWNCFPAIEIDGQYFILSSGISGAGGIRSILDYLEWCRCHGSFRRAKLPVYKIEKTTTSAKDYFMSHQWTSVVMEKSIRTNIENYVMSQVFE